jgi:hypothetical protein
VAGKTSAVLVSFFILVAAAPTARAEEHWVPHLDVGAFAADEPRPHRAQGELFLPLGQSDVDLTFAQITGKLYSSGDVEGHAILAYRRLFEPVDTGRIFTVFAALDNYWEKSGLWGASESYPTAGGGFEYLTREFDVRGNFYIALGDQRVVGAQSSSSAATATNVDVQVVVGQFGTTTTTTTTTTVTTTTQTQQLLTNPLFGADLEVGARVPFLLREDDSRELRLFAAGLWLGRGGNDFLGGRLRAEYRVYQPFESVPGSRLVLHASARYDELNDDMLEAGVVLRLPLGRDSADALAFPLMVRRMTDPIPREIAGAERELRNLTRVTTSTTTDVAVTFVPAEE